MQESNKQTPAVKPAVRAIIDAWGADRPGFTSPGMISRDVLGSALDIWCGELCRPVDRIPIPPDWIATLPKCLRSDPTGYLATMSDTPAPYWNAMAKVVREALPGGPAPVPTVESTDPVAASSVEQMHTGNLEYREDLRITVALTGIDQYPEGIWNALMSAVKREIKARSREVSVSADHHDRLDSSAVNRLEETIRLYRAVQDGYARFEKVMMGDGDGADEPPF